LDSLYLNQFLLLAAAHLLAVISPGPDFAVVIKQSISSGKRHAIYTSVGIGSAILIHVLYSALGIGLIISQSVALFSALKYLCAGYLIYLGISAFRAPPPAKLDLASSTNKTVQSLNKSFMLGFLTNVLNPKATLFFLSIFSVIVDANTPLIWLVFYAVYLSIATALWFCMVSFIFSKEAVRTKFVQLGQYFNRTMGTVLVLLGIKVAIAEL